MKLRAVILANESRDDHLPWSEACEKHADRLDYRVVNLVSDSWLEQIREQPFDLLLARPGGLTAHYKQLYDERIFILGVELGYTVFPAPLEIFLYENKRFLASWLKAWEIPSPVTHIFYEYDEALSFIEESACPMVAKTNIGASGSGVTILESARQARDYLEKTFTGSGAPQRLGPNLAKGRLLQRGLRYIVQPSMIPGKLDVYMTKRISRQKGFVIIQEYVPHEFEWRAVRIGESFFAHKKLKSGDKASGSLLKLYDNPPYELLDFIKGITDRHRLFSQAVDLFESDGRFLVNEMQCIFGQSDPYQMLVDGEAGRYRFLDGRWVFEAGDFAANACFNLRVEYLIDQFQAQ